MELQGPKSDNESLNIHLLATNKYNTLWVDMGAYNIQCLCETSG